MKSKGKLYQKLFCNIMLWVAVCGVIGGCNTSSKSDNVYVCLSDGEYELITNLKKDENIPISSSKSQDINQYLVAFSPDEKYIYYYTKYDSNYETGTLCKAEYDQLTRNSKKNENYIETIATNVSLGFEFLQDGTIIYKDGNRSLYHYNNEKSIEIATNVGRYYTDKIGRVVYETRNLEGTLLLCGTTIADVDNKIILASDYFYSYNMNDFDNILYTKSEYDNTFTLYTVGFEKESKEIAKRVNIIRESDGKTYFTILHEEKLSLYEFVQDDFVDEDAGLGLDAPKQEDFKTIPVYEYKMISGDDLSEDDYEELYTSCTKKLYGYGGSEIFSSSMTDVLNYWVQEDVIKATKNFIAKFSSEANEDGYILVTDEVKEALQEINKLSDEYKEDEWLHFCYYKKLKWMQVDKEAYNLATEKWSNAYSRLIMRETLKSDENACAVYSLCCYEDGKVKTIEDELLNFINFEDAFIYNTIDTIDEKIKIQDVTSINMVKELFYIDYKKQNYILPDNGTNAYQISMDAAKILANVNDFNFYVTDDDIYMSKEFGDTSSNLFVAITNDRIVENFVEISNDARILKISGSDIYYADGIYSNNGAYYFDLYLYNNGENIRLASDVIWNNINLYADDVILAYTNYDGSYGYELTMIDKNGEKTLIADGVTQYIRVDENVLLYLSAGDLYCYNGKEKNIVKSDVDWCWSLKSMKIIETLCKFQ